MDLGHPATHPSLETACVAAGPRVRPGARVDHADLAAIGSIAVLGFASPNGAAPLRTLLET